MSCAGLNQFLALDVPAGNTDGTALDVSTLVAAKTLYISGNYVGTYVILGSHDNVKYVPIASFKDGQGPQTIRRDIMATLSSMKVRRNADRSVVVNLAGQTVCTC